MPQENAVPGAVIAIQSFGDFLEFNPHLHVLGTDGCFYGNGIFMVAPRFDTKPLEEIFRYKVFNMLLSKGKITQDLVSMLLSWHHSGFNVFCGPRIQHGDQQAMENLALYIIRASFSQERMTYIPEEAKVSYQSKDGKEEKVFDALEWLAAMCSHVPNKGEQMVRYYGYYSNVSRVKRHKKNQDGLIRCRDVKARPPPRANALPKYELYIDYSASKLPVSDNLSRASSSNEWLYVDPEYPETYTG